MPTLSSGPRSEVGYNFLLMGRRAIRRAADSMRDRDTSSHGSAVDTQSRHGTTYFDLFHLEPLLFLWCRHQESNPGPTDYKSVALPAELYRLCFELIAYFVARDAGSYRDYSPVSRPGQPDAS